jgi:hypothetical protein
LLFKKIVLNHFIINYQLSITKFVNNLNIHNKNLIYVKGNYAIINNKIVNLQYNVKLDETKYSLMMILYKNIKYKEPNSTGDQPNSTGDQPNSTGDQPNSTGDQPNSTGDQPNSTGDQPNSTGEAILNSDIKKNIYKIFHNLDQKLNVSDVMIIGRKYKTNNKIISNSLGCYCTFDVLKIKEKVNISKRNKNVQTEVPLVKTNLRRTFLLNLKAYINQHGTEFNTIYINNMIQNSVFLDVEYTNDIYDDFSTFPISKDNSMLFIIGLLRIVKNECCYTDFTSKRLTYQEEYRILDNFLDYISNNYKNNKFRVTVFHWSHADKYIIEKSLARYPDLQKKYDPTQIIYVDLLIILKQTINLPSYSLKYVAKELLNLRYDTDCQNGLDAMCSIIQNDIMLTNNEMNIHNQDLLSLQSSKDIVKYNKIDTTLLYDVLIYFIKN